MNTAGKTILIVDDSILILDRITAMLSELEIVSAVSKAANYAEALILLAQENPDIILLDIHLPGRNGIELLRFINSTYPSKKVVMLTNESGEYYRTLCKEAGASYFIDKSKEFEMIPEILSSFA